VLKAAADGSPSGASDRRWAVVRVLLGLIQVFGASLGVILLIETGVTRLTLLIVALTASAQR
jgi:hypothetical protein